MLEHRYPTSFLLSHIQRFVYFVVRKGASDEERRTGWWKSEEPSEKALVIFE